MNHEEIEQIHRDEMARAIRAVKKPDPKLSRIEKIRQVVTKHQCNRVDGVLVDAFTAQYIVALYDNLQDPKNKKSYEAMSVRKMAAVAFKLLGK